MLSMMLIVPTIIVMLSTEPEVQEVSVDMNQNDENNDENINLPSFDVKVKRSGDGEIETVPLEDYVINVVASEMPAEFEVEALKAQAIAARTYIVNHLLLSDNEEFIITDETEHQVYQNVDELKQNWGKDFQWKLDKITDAVHATQGKIITYKEEPITPTFFSMSNGYTEDAENYWGNDLPYLKSVESKWEVDNPKFTEQKILTLHEVSNKLGVSLPENKAVTIKMERTNSNRVDTLYMDDSKFSGRTIREKLGLRSNDFTVKQKDNHLIFTTKGYGHGVGMSQYGANGMAQEGKNYKEILTYYYQDVEISTISESAPALVAK